MKKVGVIGSFGVPNNCSDGQTVKTQIITTELIRVLGDDIIKYNTHGGAKKIVSHIWHACKFIKQCKNVIIMPAHNGIRIFAPLLALLNKLFNRRLHYIVIGGWLPEFIDQHQWLKSYLLKFTAIYVETSTMKVKLEKRGFHNILIMPNCKTLSILRDEDLKREYKEPYQLCTLSRVIKEKGIEDAINAVKQINTKYGRVIFKLDIYGPIANTYQEQFALLQSEFPEYISYGGVVPFDKTVEILKNYYALLFPTHYYTEGIPGTIIDAYAAGIPTIFSRWVNYADLIDDGQVGIGYDFNNYDEFVAALLTIVENPQYLVDMKPNCLQAAKKFTTSEIVNNILIPRFL